MSGAGQAATPGQAAYEDSPCRVSGGEHDWVTHFGPSPVSVQVCVLCGGINWDELQRAIAAAAPAALQPALDQDYLAELAGVLGLRGDIGESDPQIILLQCIGLARELAAAAPATAAPPLAALVKGWQQTMEELEEHPMSSDEAAEYETLREVIRQVRAATQEPQPQAAPELAAAALVLADDEVIASRVYAGGMIVIAFAPGAPIERAAELRDAMAAQCDVPVFTVADVAAIRTWQPREVPGLAYAQVERDDYARRLKAADESWTKLAAERDRLRELLGEILAVIPHPVGDAASQRKIAEWRERAGLPASAGQPGTEG